MVANAKSATPSIAAVPVGDDMWGDGKGLFTLNGRAIRSGTSKTVATAMAEQLAARTGETVQVVRLKTGNVVKTVQGAKSQVKAEKAAPVKAAAPAKRVATAKTATPAAKPVTPAAKSQDSRYMIGSKVLPVGTTKERAIALAKTEATRTGKAVQVVMVTAVAKVEPVRAAKAAPAAKSQVKAEKPAAAKPASTAGKVATATVIKSGKRGVARSEYHPASVKGWDLHSVRVRKGNETGRRVLEDGTKEFSIICTEHGHVHKLERLTEDRARNTAADWCTAKGCKNGVNRKG